MRDLIATTARGLEEVCADELRELGASSVAVERGAVRFRGDQELLYRANLWLRTASRVLVSFGGFEFGSPDHLHEAATELPWEDAVGDGATIAVIASSRDAVEQGIRNAHFAALRIKDAICDRLRARRGKRPNVDLERPDVLVRARIVGGRCDLSLDATGSVALHERGYRQAARVAGGTRRGGGGGYDGGRPGAGAPDAPLRPFLAAGILALAKYAGDRPLLDPLCGTGTLLVEAAWIATDRAPGLGRESPFGFSGWADADRKLLHRVRTEAHQRAEAGEDRSPPPIVGRDLNPRAIDAARASAEAAGVDAIIRVEVGDARTAEPPGSGAGLVVTNPPYGERLGEERELEALYRGLGDALKQRFPGWSAWVLCGNPKLGKSVGLKTSRRHPLWNGAIECRLLAYDLFAGARKQREELRRDENAPPEPSGSD